MGDGKAYEVYLNAKAGFVKMKNGDGIQGPAGRRGGRDWRVSVGSWNQFRDREFSGRSSMRLQQGTSLSRDMGRLTDDFY